MSIKIYFGVPGSGKTTLAAKIVHDNLKKGITTYSNVPIKGAILFDSTDIGKYDISDGEMVLDEAGIVFNSRKFKTLPQSTIEWFKLSRHYGIRNIHVFSQSYDDMDITLRRLADEIFVIKRSIIPFVFCMRRIKVKVGIDEESHQITDQYFFQFLGVKPYLGYKFWHMFDSWSAPVLPCISWYYSSFESYTIDSKHSRLIYKKLHKQGKLRYKIFHSKFVCRIVNNFSIFVYKLTLGHKITMKKSARIKTIRCFVSQKIKAFVAECSAWGSARKRPPAAMPDLAHGKEIDVNDIEAFKAFFTEHRDVAIEEKPKEKERKKADVIAVS